MQNAKCKMQNAKCKMQNVKMQNAKIRGKWETKRKNRSDRKDAGKVFLLGSVTMNI